MLHTIVTTLSKIFDWSSTADQREFWIFTFFSFFFQITVSALILFVHAMLISFAIDDWYNFEPHSFMATFRWLNGFHLLPALMLFLPSLALTARRLRDAGQSPFWMLLMLTGFGGILIFVACALLPSQARKIRHTTPSRLKSNQLDL
jgi:uncharacterized membrane protein YhaH (DUF805 family)